MHENKIPLEVSYMVNHAPEIVKQLDLQLAYTKEGDIYIHDKGGIYSFIKATQLTEEISCMVSEFRVNRVARIVRNKSTRPRLFVIDFHISYRATLSVPEIPSSKQLVYGAYLSNDNTYSYADFLNDTTFQQVAIFMDQEAAVRLFELEGTEVGRFIQSNEPFLLQKEIPQDVGLDIHEVLKRSKQDKATKSYLHGVVLKILSDFFQSVGKSVKKSTVTHARAEDVRQILNVCDYINDHLEEKLSTSSLVKLTSMSTSKFRKEFKDATGRSPIEYVKNAKLWYAKTLLEQGESVTKAGHRIGYTNMSYFSRCFKALFHIGPRAYRTSQFI